MTDAQRLTLFFSSVVAVTMAGSNGDAAEDSPIDLSPHVVLNSWREWARRFQSHAWEGEIRQDYVDRVEVTVADRKGDGQQPRKARSNSEAGVRVIEGTVTLYFVGKWPEILWDSTREETIKRPGQPPTHVVVRKGALVSRGRAIGLAGTGAGWVIRDIESLYDPDAPPAFWDSFDELYRYHRPFRALVNPYGMHRWVKPLEEKRVEFDRIRWVDKRVEVVWHLNFEGLPREEAIKLRLYRRGRWILDPSTAWLPVMAETNGILADGAPLRAVTKVECEVHAGVPIEVRRDVDVVFGPDDGGFRRRITGTQRVVLRQVSSTLDRSKLTLRYFGLPDKIRLGPPAAGVPRWQRLLVAALVLLLSGGLAWWLGRKRAV